MALIVVIGILLMTGTSQSLTGDLETTNLLAQCKTAIKEIEQEDRATITDDSPSRLYSTWLSQECELRAGPEYLIRKYTFFENGTFLLLRYHYAEESCSIATHTVTIQGFIKLLGPSVIVSGATETRFHVDAVNIIPLNRQVAHKFGRRMNLTCGPQPRWRAYVSELIYEQSRQHSASSLWQGPIYNSLQASPTKKRFGVDCLEPFGIEFAELRLIRVQKKSFGLSSLQLFLASPASNVYSRSSYKPTSLQSTAMIRADTASSCPICSSVSRSTEFSPPLLHQVAALPALIGGYWHSERCESSEGGGGVWSKRQYQIYSGDKLWTGRWDYYDDPQCSKFLYAVTAAGSYVQRAERQRRHKEVDEDVLFNYFRSLNTSARTFFKRSAIDTSAVRAIQSDVYRNSSNIANESLKDERKFATRRKKTKKQKRSLTDSVYQLLYDAQSSITLQSRFVAMLRGHETYKTTTSKPSIWSDTLSGTTELDLHIAESILIPEDATVSIRCHGDLPGVPLITWPRNCVPRTIEAPSILGLRVKLGVNWNGQYTLLLGSRDDYVWEAPLRQCAQIPPHNPVLQAHLRRSVGLRFGLLSSASTRRIFDWFLLSQIFLCCVYYLIR